MKGFIEVQLDENNDFEVWGSNESILISLSEISVIREAEFGCYIYPKSKKMPNLEYAPALCVKTSYDEIKRLIQEAENG